MMGAIREKIDAWIAYEGGRPKCRYEGDPGSHDRYRSEHDLDCVLAGGDLRADTIISLWLPLRFTLKALNGYEALEKYGPMSDKIGFLKTIARPGVLEKLLPEDNDLVANLTRLFDVGQERCNVMILPERWINTARGRKPYYDYMPGFLYDCFEGGRFSCAFGAGRGFPEWVRDQSLEGFFDYGTIERESVRDLAGTGDVKCGLPPTTEALNGLLTNYVAILESRRGRVGVN